MGFFKELRHAWNAFTDAKPDEDRSYNYDYGASYGGFRPDRNRWTLTGDNSIIQAVYTRLAIDVAAHEIQHVKLDENGRYSDTVKSGLQNCLTLEANMDQGSRAFKQDAARMLFDKGSIGIVPVDTVMDPELSGGIDIKTVRVAEILDWRPRHVKLDLYNEAKGRRESITLAKSVVAIVENPFYSVMNEPNSTLRRLTRKLAILDSIDEQSGSGKLDLIVQLPYVIKTDTKRAEAEKRRKDIEMQMTGSKYGIAYTDGTEKITQLNRPVENNMLKQIEYLEAMLFSQLGLTKAVMEGTASEAEMLNYYNRTIEPILAALTQAMKRTFLTKTARSQGHSIEYYRDPFKLVSATDMATIADIYARNEVLSSNEIRGAIGYRPVKDPKADELRNSNMPVAPGTAPTTEPIE